MIEVSLEHTASGARNDVVERCFDFLNQAEIEFVQKDRVYELIRSERPGCGDFVRTVCNGYQQRFKRCSG